MNIKQMLLVLSFMLMCYFAFSCLTETIDCDLHENINNPECMLKNKEMPEKIYK